MQNKEVGKERIISAIKNKEMELSRLKKNLASTQTASQAFGVPMDATATTKDIERLTAEINLLKNRLATA